MNNSTSKSIRVILNENSSMFINDPIIEGAYVFKSPMGPGIVEMQFQSHPTIVKEIHVSDIDGHIFDSNIPNFWEDVDCRVSEGMNRTADADDEEDVEVIDGVQVIRKHPAGAVFSDGGLKDEEGVSV